MSHQAKGIAIKYENHRYSRVVFSIRPSYREACINAQQFDDKCNVEWCPFDMGSHASCTHGPTQHQVLPPCFFRSGYPTDFLIL